MRTSYSVDEGVGAAIGVGDCLADGSCPWAGAAPSCLAQVFPPRKNVSIQYHGSLSTDGGDVDDGGAVAIGLEGCLILTLIVDMLGLSVLYLVAWFNSLVHRPEPTTVQAQRPTKDTTKAITIFLLSV